MKFVATKKCMTTIFFHPSLLFLDPGSEIRDPESGMGKNQDPGSGIYIPDSQHCLTYTVDPSPLPESALELEIIKNINIFKVRSKKSSFKAFSNELSSGEMSPVLPLKKRGIRNNCCES
jgi:hypothetical protein